MDKKFSTNPIPTLTWSNLTLPFDPKTIIVKKIKTKS